VYLTSNHGTVFHETWNELAQHLVALLKVVQIQLHHVTNALEHLVITLIVGITQCGNGLQGNSALGISLAGGFVVLLLLVLIMPLWWWWWWW
jgi:hypothetical protein